MTPRVLIGFHFLLFSLGAHSTPNVIYILADDLGYGDLSCYGQEKLETPHIDRLATEGLRFTQHYSGNTVCSPSRAVLMTGLHSGKCYLRGNVPGSENAAALAPETFVLPELFRLAGYATGAFGKWGLGETNVEGAPNPLSHGFDEFYGWKSQRIAHTYFPSSLVHNGEEIPMEEGTFVNDLIMDQARAFIHRHASAKKPFFCYIPTAVPHAAMHAPADLHDKWRKVFPEFDSKIGKYGAGPDESCPDVINPIAGFAAMMENFDNEVGAILALLDDLGIDDETLVLFSSDNGAHTEGGHDPSFWNSTGDLRGHKRDMHEGGIRTPFLARWPGSVPSGEVSHHMSSFQDVLPTMAELLDKSLPAPVDGISFLPTLLGTGSPQAQHDYLYWEFCRGADQTIDSQALRRGTWKLFRGRNKPAELFDLSKDPREEKDLAAAFPEMVQELEELMEEAHHPLSP
ncbi:MAG: arylsulfatase [Verrucomicrobiota bacterium]